MYEGGCCIATSIIGGHEFMDKQPEDLREMFKKAESGVCAPGFITDYLEKSGPVSVWEYESFIFSNPEMNQWFFKDWPTDQARPDSFDGWAEAMQQYFDVMSW